VPQIFRLRTILPKLLPKQFGKTIRSLRSVTAPLAIALMGASTILVVPGQYSPAIANAALVIGSGTLVYWLGLTFLPEQPPIIESRFPDFPKA
jgi:multisubunit Na+/H+ antiporter MnhB subunit